MAYDFCRRCGQFANLLENHKCPPEWEVWYPEHGDRTDAKTVYAYDEELAVEKWAEQYDGEHFDYGMAEGEIIEVCVSAVGSEEVKKFKVYGEPTVDYHASEIEDAQVHANE